MLKNCKTSSESAAHVIARGGALLAAGTSVAALYSRDFVSGHAHYSVLYQLIEAFFSNWHRKKKFIFNEVMVINNIKQPTYTIS